MRKFFIAIGIYSTCVFIHNVVNEVAERFLDGIKQKEKEEQGNLQTYACGYEVESESYDYSDEEDHERLDRIGF